jgi:hypothetical protein
MIGNASGAIAAIKEESRSTSTTRRISSRSRDKPRGRDRRRSTRPDPVRGHRSGIPISIVCSWRFAPAVASLPRCGSSDLRKRRNGLAGVVLRAPRGVADHRSGGREFAATAVTRAADARLLVNDARLCRRPRSDMRPSRSRVLRRPDRERLRRACSSRACHCTGAPRRQASVLNSRMSFLKRRSMLAGKACCCRRRCVQSRHNCCQRR